MQIKIKKSFKRFKRESWWRDTGRLICFESWVLSVLYPYVNDIANGHADAKVSP